MFRKKVSLAHAREAEGEAPLKWGFKYLIEPDKRLVHVQFGKHLAIAEIENYARQLRMNPSFDASFAEIVDLTRVEVLDLKGQDILKLADHVDPFSFESKRAFVVRNEEQAHLAKMYAISRMSHDNIRSFPIVSEAERWILTGEIGAGT